LVEGARFCHKCGRPVREEDRLAEDAAMSEVVMPSSSESPYVAIAPPLPPPAQPEIGFQNKVAVRIALLLAGPMYFLMSFLFMLPGGFLLGFLGLFGAGFLSVALYTRRTGSGVSIISGARMGWICGVFVFLITLILLTVGFAVASNGDFAQMVQEQLKRQGQNAADVQRFVEVIRNPAALFMGLATIFVMITTVPSLGGALGAKILEGKQR
jgi:hypothetical protein